MNFNNSEHIDNVRFILFIGKNSTTASKLQICKLDENKFSLSNNELVSLLTVCEC